MIWLLIFFEHQWQEHSEPGTGNPPTPRTDDPEKDFLTGSRRDSPPIVYNYPGAVPGPPPYDDGP